MRDFGKTYTIVRNLFQVKGKDREGFDSDIYDAITVSVIDLEDSYKDRIASKIILDNDTFSYLPDLGDRSVANIYLNRLLKNVKKIIYSDKVSEKAYYDPAKHEIVINKSKIDSSLKYYNTKDLNSDQKKKLKDKLYAITILHVLDHASVDNGICIGYYPPRDKTNTVIEYNRLYVGDKSGDIMLGASKLEEIFAQQSALDRAEKLCIYNIYDNVTIPEFSPECENASIQPFAEFISRSIPNIRLARYVDPLKFLASCDNIYGLPKQKEKHFSIALNRLLKYIVDTRDIRDGFDSLVNLQKYFLDVYDINVLSEIKVDTFDKTKACKICNDLMTFDMLLVRDNNNPNTINVTRLEELKAKAIELGKQKGIDMILIANVEVDNINKHFDLDNVPYQYIKYIKQL